MVHQNRYCVSGCSLKKKDGICYSVTRQRDNVTCPGLLLINGLINYNNNKREQIIDQENDVLEGHGRSNGPCLIRKRKIMIIKKMW